MFQLARVRTIRMTRGFDFAQGFRTIGTKFYICLSPDIELALSLTIIMSLVVALKFQCITKLGYNFTPNLHVICDAPSVEDRQNLK